MHNCVPWVVCIDDRNLRHVLLRTTSQGGVEMDNRRIAIPFLVGEPQ